MKELPIGTEIKLPFVTLKVEAVRGHSCYNCFFIEVCEENGEFVSESFGGCDSLEREDETNVIFKEIGNIVRDEVPKEDFDNLLRLKSKDINEKQMNNIVEEVNKVLYNYPYPEKDKSHENME